MTLALLPLLPWRRRRLAAELEAVFAAMRADCEREVVAELIEAKRAEGYVPGPALAALMQSWPLEEVEACFRAWAEVSPPPPLPPALDPLAALAT